MLGHAPLSYVEHLIKEASKAWNFPPLDLCFVGVRQAWSLVVRKGPSVVLDGN